MRRWSTLSVMNTADVIGHAVMFELPIMVVVTIRALTVMRPASPSALGDIIMMTAMVLAGMDLVTMGLEDMGLETTGLEDTAAVTTTKISRRHSPRGPIEQTWA